VPANETVDLGAPAAPPTPDRVLAGRAAAGRNKATSKAVMSARRFRLAAAWAAATMAAPVAGDVVGDAE
jgi:hypothetical protein